MDQAPEPTLTPEATTQPRKPTREVQPKPTPILSPTPTLTPRPEVQESASISSIFPSEIRQPSTSPDLDTVLAKATGTPTVPPSATVDDNLSISTSAGTLSIAPTTTPTSQSTAPQDIGGEGTSTGAKAGIAFGVLGGVFLVGLAAFLLFSRRRRQAATAREEADDEKYHRNDNPFDTMTIRSDPHAPRISLRPVTQLLPNWNIDKRASKGAGAALTPAAAVVNANGQKYGMQERTATSQSTHPANPFGSQAERITEPATTMEHGAVPPSDPFTASGPAIAAGAAAGALTRKTSMRKTGPSKLDLTVPPALGPMPPSPAGTEFSMTSVSPGSAVLQSSGAAAIAAAGGPSNSNVHRVQLDFKPSLDDEMEMKAGDLVRLLHEYDDGWVS